VVRSQTKDEENTDTATSPPARRRNLGYTGLEQQRRRLRRPNQQFKKSEKLTEIQYEIGKTTSRMIRAAGALSVSRRRKPSQRAGGTGASQSGKNRSPEEIEKYAALSQAQWEFKTGK